MRLSTASLLRAWPSVFTRASLTRILPLWIFAFAVPLLPAASWDKIDPADLAATECTWWAGADAEMLIDRNVVTDDNDGARFQRYQRTKIYTAKGVEDSGKLAFEYPGNASISGLEARVVKQDGRIIELKKTDFFVSDVARRFGRKLKKTSMVFPDLAPGDIVECRWRESIDDGLVNAWDYCQRVVPVRNYSMMIDAEGYADLLISWYNMPTAKPTKKGGRQGMEATFVPPFEDEEFTPPERDIRGWVWINYATRYREDEKWKETCHDSESFFRDNIGANDAIKARVTELIAGATSDDEKLTRLYDFCRRKITNFQYYESADIQKAVKKREDRGVDFVGARRTLERGGGFPNEIDYLFAAMASAAGYEVRQVLCAGRDTVLDTKIVRGWALMNNVVVGVKVGDVWRYYSPGDHIVPAGLLRWECEGAIGLITSKRDATLVKLPMVPADQSRVRRVGRFTLDTEGALEGTVEETFSGHMAEALKRIYWPKNSDECRLALEKRVTDRLSTAEISELTWEHVNDLEYPVVIRCKIRVPGYAEMLGERLMVDPSYFEHGRSPLFAPENRRHDIMHDYPYSEQDEIEITLPEGHLLDQPSAPHPVADASGYLKVEYALRFSKKTGVLKYSRNFSVSTPEMIVLKKESYPMIKALFTAVHESDSHALLVKAVEAPAAP